MHFDVRALSNGNQMVRMAIEAVDEADARQQVSARGYSAASISPAQRRLAVNFGAPRRRFSLLLFSQELLALLSAGLSIVECLEALLEKEAHQPTQAVLQALLDGLRNGKSFSSALAEQSFQFSPLYVGIVRTAEGTSDLPQALQRFIDYQQRVDLVRNKVISAAIYPSILFIVGGAVSLFLIGYVVPKFAQVYQDTGRDLPWMSRMLLEVGRFAGAYAQQLLVGGIALVAVLGVATVRYVQTGGVARLLAALPGIAPRTRIYQLARLYLTLGMLLEGGIPISKALETAQGIVHHDMRLALQAVRSDIESGQSLSLAFETHGLTTPISLRMLRVGERSGDLGGMLNQSALFYDGDIARWIDRFTRTFEPLLMAAIGLIVGTIVVLLYMPIFDLAGSLS